MMRMSRWMPGAVRKAVLEKLELVIRGGGKSHKDGNSFISKN